MSFNFYHICYIWHLFAICCLKKYDQIRFFTGGKITLMMTKSQKLTKIHVSNVIR